MTQGKSRWTVEVTETARRFVDKLAKGNRKVASAISAAILDLADDPFPPGHRKLKGSANEYRVRVGDYRILYTVVARQRIVVVYVVARRDEAY